MSMDDRRLENGEDRAQTLRPNKESGMGDATQEDGQAVMDGRMPSHQSIGTLSAPTGKTFSQEDVDRIVKERLEREKLARERATARAKEEAEAEALKKNQEWQALADVNAKKADELAARVAQLEPVGEQVERYRSALERSLAAEKKDLPKHVLVLLEKLDPVEQIDYLAANRDALGRTTGAAGVPASPEPKERRLSDDDLERARRGQANLYQNF